MMITPEQIAARKQARQIAEQLVDLVLGETKAMSKDAKVAFFETLARLLPVSVPPAKPLAGIEPFTDAQARAWGKTRIQFGKYQGQQIDEIPLSYLEKLAEPNDFTRHLRRYLASTRIALEQEAAEQQGREE
jgi:uncharacterized protein (DUF3820 family)